MPTKTVTVGSKVGLHARPAALFVQAAAQTGLPVWIGKPGQERADARSILSVLALDARGGDQVELTAEGEGADAALETLAELVAKDHDS